VTPPSPRSLSSDSHRRHRRRGSSSSRGRSRSRSVDTDHKETESTVFEFTDSTDASTTTSGTSVESSGDVAVKDVTHESGLEHDDEPSVAGDKSDDALRQLRSPTNMLPGLPKVEHSRHRMEPVSFHFTLQRV
jgi:hypothetical protein